MKGLGKPEEGFAAVHAAQVAAEGKEEGEFPYVNRARAKSRPNALPIVPPTSVCMAKGHG